MRYTVSFIVFIFCLLTGGDVYAQSIGVDDATKIARQWLGRGGRSLKKAGQDGSDAVSLAHAVASEHDGNANVYVFTTDRSFVIVAGDECVDNPILGFSDEGGFSAEGMPDAMKWLLGEYSQQIDVVKVAEGEEVRAKRMNLKKDVPWDGYHHEFQDVIDINDGGPLIKTFWQQDEPYNWDIGNSIGNTNGVVCATGCAATALAQIINYHKWPVTGTGSHTYRDYNGMYSDNTNGTLITSDFYKHTYDWDHMRIEYEGTCVENAPDNTEGKYNKREGDAVAMLMYDCGVAIDMRYGHHSTTNTSSGGKEYLVANALVNYFGYASSVTAKARGNLSTAGTTPNYTDEEWEAMLKAEIDGKRPVFMVGQAADGQSSHAYVCDGYGYGHGTDYYGEPNDGVLYFHINWGWGALKYQWTYNGYFRSTVFKYHSANKDNAGNYPLHDYNYKQYAVIGIQPDYGDYWNEWVDYGNCEYDYSAFINYKNDVHVKGRLSRDGKFRELEIDNWGNGLGYIKGKPKMTCVINNTTGEVVTPPFNTGYVYSKDGVEHEMYAASPEASIGYSNWTKESLSKRDNPCDFQGRYDFENKKLTLNLAYYYYTDYYKPWSGGTYANTLQLPTLSYTLPVSSAHIATLYLDYNAEIPTDEWEIVGEEERGKPHVYYVTYENDNEVNFVLVNGGVIPAYTPVIVQAKEGNYYFWEDTNTKVNDLPKIEYNLLHGTIDEYTFSDAELENVYFLYTRRIGEDVSPVFIKAAKNTTENTQTIDAHKAWLEMPKHMSLAKELMVSDFTTKIENLSVGAKPDSRRFSITGQQVDRNYQGIVIVDGKKILCR